jgi:hypothetical protein
MDDAGKMNVKCGEVRLVCECVVCATRCNTNAEKMTHIFLCKALQKTKNTMTRDLARHRKGILRKEGSRDDLVPPRNRPKVTNRAIAHNFACTS